MTCRKMIKADDVRSMLTRMLEDVAEGHVYVITKYGKPIAEFRAAVTEEPELDDIALQPTTDEHPAAHVESSASWPGSTTSTSTFADAGAKVGALGTAGELTRDGLLREANAAGSRTRR